MLIKTYSSFLSPNLETQQKDLSSSLNPKISLEKDVFLKYSKAPTFGMTVTPYFTKIFNSIIYFETASAKCTKSINFNSPTKIPDALSELTQIEAAKDLGVYNISKISRFQKAIEEVNFMKDKTVLGLESGADSLVLELNDKTVLKLSQSRNYPIEERPFDLPVLDKGQIPNSNIYYYIQPKADTENATMEHLKQVLEQIKNTGHTAQFDLKFNESSLRQIGLYQGIPYLIDPACAYKRNYNNWSAYSSDSFIHSSSFTLNPWFQNFSIA